MPPWQVAPIVHAFGHVPQCRASVLRLASQPFTFRPCWFGRPRTVSGFAAMGLVLSSAVHLDNNADWWAAFLVVVGLSIMNVVPVPYIKGLALTGDVRALGVPEKNLLAGFRGFRRPGFNPVEPRNGGFDRIVLHAAFTRRQLPTSRALTPRSVSAQGRSRTRRFGV